MELERIFPYLFPWFLISMPFRTLPTIAHGHKVSLRELEKKLSPKKKSL